jgi:probable selenium-dependent hydroxylase accessory protein YqeC
VRLSVNTSLVDALEVRPGDSVGIVGAGGKTSLMFALGGELVSRGVPTLMTTTTRILYPRGSPVPKIILAPENRTTMGEICRGIERYGMVLAGRERLDSKIVGFTPAFVDDLAAANRDITIIAECDGAKGRSLKVPRSFEPPLAGSTSLLVVVIGADCFGKPIASDTVFEPEAVAEITGVDVDAVVDERVVVPAILSPASYAGRRPPDARFSVFINKTGAMAGPALGIGISIKGESLVDSVVLGSIRTSAERRLVVLR